MGEEKDLDSVRTRDREHKGELIKGASCPCNPSAECGDGLTLALFLVMAIP